MKLTIAFFGIFLAAFAGNASAQAFDHLYIDSIITIPFAVDPTLVEGPPDTKQLRLQGGSEYLGVQFAAGTQPVKFDSGSKIQVFWIRETADTNAGAIQFLYEGYDGTVRLGPIVRVDEVGPLNVPETTTIIVPDTGFNGLSMSVAGDSGANSFYIDAMELLQSGVAAVGGSDAPGRFVLASYPNPFEHSSVSTLHIDAPAAGRGELLVSDALGREVERVPIGELHAGAQDVNFALGRAGVFFARLFIEGAPVGGPLKLVAE